MVDRSKKKHSKSLSIFGAAVSMGVFGIPNRCFIRKKLTQKLAQTFMGLYEPNRTLVSPDKKTL